jgi:hypothetical protein
MAARQRVTLHRTDPVATKGQGPRRGDAWVELAQSAGRGVARVGEGLGSRRTLTRVEAFEAAMRHVHLAAHLEDARHRIAGQAQRDRPDGAHVGGDVLATSAVAARGAAHQHPVLVPEAHGEPVELGLDDVGDAVEPETLADPAVELAHAVVIEGVGEREHGQGVHHLAERRGWRAAHALRRRVGADQLRALGLEGGELGHQPIVLGVRNLRVVEHVVAIVVVGDRRAQRRDASACPRQGRAHPRCVIRRRRACSAMRSRM